MFSLRSESEHSIEERRSFEELCNLRTPTVSTGGNNNNNGINNGIGSSSINNVNGTNNINFNNN